ncbi:acetoacetate decarboxylase family protein [Paraburkholderia pallida]|uniref:Acetoacetate decarboxylase n=1 Tax=Paraburkholderia pallida TaxID=2547399 RepID=A0A4P7D441_9BURK|nr:acetoacetate decarboxylase family protein [Paraburkholderia pallida]QBR02097.1 acetoacetate decarboxylase [Paraburkholderia pallida]
MLKGYMAPLSPLGKASINPPPPWHYSGDVIGAEFWAEPEATAATLPPGLDPDPSTAGHGVILFIDWQFTAQDDEFLDPARYQYRECLFLVDAVHKGTPVMWCPYIYVDNDAALARGWAQGFPKKLASVYQTRTFAAPSAAAAPVAAGSRFGASLSAHGERLAEARITLRQPVADPKSLLARPTVNRRYFASLAAGLHDKPAVDELVLSVTDNLSVADAWAGDAELLFPDARGEELCAFGPVKVGGGFRFSLAYSVTDLKLLEDLTRPGK